MTFFKETLIVSLCCLLLISGCEAGSIRIKGELQHLQNNKYVYLYQYFGQEITKIDSALLNNGQFEFNPKKPLPRGFYRIGVSNTLSVIVILGNESPEIKADLNDISGTTIISGSEENELYKGFLQFNEKFNRAGAQIQTEAQALGNPQQVSVSDTAAYNGAIRKLQTRVDSITADKKKYYDEILKKHKTLYISKVVEMFSDESSKENFFTPTIMKDTELSHGDLLSTRFSAYLQKYAGNSLELAEAESRELLKKEWAPQNKEVIYLTLIKLFFQYDQDFSRNQLAEYVKEFPASIHCRKLLSEIPKGPPAIGEAAPELMLADTTGKTVALSSLKGKIVLIDFWASWCRPCRMENPNVVKAYDKYKDAGFTVFSVSLDDNKANWVRAIKADNLKWNSHVSDLKGWQSAAAKLYGVNGIPSTFLLDRDGRIIGKNLRGDALEAKLIEVCQKK
ncbi:MAG TPA: TlpA disulfide reductase family protein [Cytophagaceae bacterium]|nr:TlpA disulfide reductase family protein [Cytophagaceae bacterium]